jgi:hypothetical protein
LAKGMDIRAILIPTWRKALLLLSVSAIILTLDRVFSYCTEDSCFNGIYRLSGGDQYTYFTLANVMKYILLASIVYALVWALYATAAFSWKRIKRRHNSHREGR